MDTSKVNFKVDADNKKISIEASLDSVNFVIDKDSRVFFVVGRIANLGTSGELIELGILEKMKDELKGFRYSEEMNKLKSERIRKALASKELTAHA